MAAVQRAGGGSGASITGSVNYAPGGPGAGAVTSPEISGNWFCKLAMEAGGGGGGITGGAKVLQVVERIWSCNYSEVLLKQHQQYRNIPCRNNSRSGLCISI